MIDLTSDKIRTDIVKNRLSCITKLYLTKINYANSLGCKYLMKLSDGYYYVKKVDELQLCNEIVGRYLCAKVGLETTDLVLLLDKNVIKIATTNYRKQNLKYNNPTDDTVLAFSNQYNVSKLKLLPKSYQKEQFKLIALDIMMEQTDRFGRNMEEIIDKNIIHLTPVIDFARSFGVVSFNFYYNPYISIPKNVENIDRFLNDFPDAYKYFLEIFSIGTEELVSCIETTYPIKVEDEIKEAYDKVISKNKSLIKSLR